MNVGLAVYMRHRLRYILVYAFFMILWNN